MPLFAAIFVENLFYRRAGLTGAEALASAANFASQTRRSEAVRGWGRPVSLATGCPWLVMTTSSPRWAKLMSLSSSD